MNTVVCEPCLRKRLLSLKTNIKTLDKGFVTWQCQQIANPVSAAITVIRGEAVCAEHYLERIQHNEKDLLQAA